MEGNWRPDSRTSFRPLPDGGRLAGSTLGTQSLHSLVSGADSCDELPPPSAGVILEILTGLWEEIFFSCFLLLRLKAKTEPKTLLPRTLSVLSALAG